MGGRDGGGKKKKIVPLSRWGWVREATTLSLTFIEEVNQRWEGFQKNNKQDRKKERKKIRESEIDV